METLNPKDQPETRGLLTRSITRRQAIKAGGIAVVGLAFSKPLIETVMPKPAFANYTPIGDELVGCTPGFWQGGKGRKLWNAVNDPDWGSEGGVGSNPYIHTTLFNSFFGVHTIAGLAGITMMDLVGTGGGPYWPRKTARDVVAAYLNAAFGFNYGMTTGQIAAEWYDAVQQYNTAGNSTSRLETLHNKLDVMNNNGDCLD